MKNKSVDGVLEKLGGLSEIELLAFTRNVFSNPTEQRSVRRFLAILRRYPRHHVVKKIIGKFDLESRAVLKKMSEQETPSDGAVDLSSEPLLRSIGEAKVGAQRLRKRWKKGRAITAENRASMKSAQYDSPFDSYLGVTPPEAFTIPGTYSSKLALPKIVLAGRQKSLVNCISSRESYREINREMVSRKDLSWLLWATQGVKKILPDGLAHFRNVPSGGSRHAFDTYLFINRVKGILPGLYFYDVKNHQLLALRQTDFTVALRKAVGGQMHLSQAAIYWVWVATPYRSEWRYGVYARKDMLIECGHICQNLYLMAEARGLGVCAASGYNQSELDGLIGVDGESEFAVYSASVSRRAKSQALQRRST